MNDEQLRQLIQKLGIVLECPRCGHKYDFENISLGSATGSTYNLKLVCKFCHTPVNASIAISGDLNGITQNMSSMTPKIDKMLDIAKPDIKKPVKINNDDIINIHQYLKEFDGNFENIFK